MARLAFRKMHGLGNDFVVIDGRACPVALDAGRMRAIADRRTGVGFDQLVIIGPSETADAGMTLFNADGSPVEACGNATRCVAALLMAETGREAVTIEGPVGPLRCRAAGEGRITAEMGPVRTGWRDIPLAREADTLALDLGLPGFGPATAVSMGNPHVVLFVDDVAALDLGALGPRLEHHPLFPERANVEFIAVEAPDRLRMRVWERGVGETRACGSGACAAVVAAHRRGLAARAASVVLAGGAPPSPGARTGWSR